LQQLAPYTRQLRALYGALVQMEPPSSYESPPRSTIPGHQRIKNNI
jgi:hypothetical protein